MAPVAQPVEGTPQHRISFILSPFSFGFQPVLSAFQSVSHPVRALELMTVELPRNQCSRQNGAMPEDPTDGDQRASGFQKSVGFVKF